MSRQYPASLNDWRAVVQQHAARVGVDLPRAIVDELAIHLEDLYAAARSDGMTADDAHERAMRALQESPLDRTEASRAPRFPQPQELQRGQRRSRRPSPVPAASDIRARHRAGPRPRDWRRDNGVYDYRCRGAASAALRRTGPPRHLLGHESGREASRTIRSRRSTSWTTARCPSSKTQRRGGVRASTWSIPVSIRCA